MTSLLLTMVVLTQAPVIGKDHKLACPEGTVQFGGMRSGRLACQSATLEGNRVFHGPYISFYASGKVAAVGQTDHGMRSGLWRFYDERGVLTGETEFKNGDFDGRRVFFSPDGKVTLEERWEAGRQVPLASRAPAITPGTGTQRR